MFEVVQLAVGSVTGVMTPISSILCNSFRTASINADSPRSSEDMRFNSIFQLDCVVSFQLAKSLNEM